MGNSLYLGGVAVDSVYLGSTKADKVYLGSTLVWSASVTTTATVATTADDGYSLNGSLTTSGTGIPIAANATNLRGFARFTNVTIPPGATIVSATLKISSFSFSGGTAACHIRAVAADNPAQPSGSSIDTATLTIATVDWSATGVTAPVTSPDIASVIQEIVNRPGWASGNALTLVATYTVATPSGTVDTGADLSETLTVTYS